MKKGISLLAGAALVALLAGSAQAADPIKIGVPGAHSGDLASYGVPSLNAAKIVAAEYNARGGIMGRQIEIVPQDDQCKPELASNAATKLLSDKVAAVMGHICSGATKAALPIYNDAKVVSISPSATTPALTKSGENPYFFRTIANDDDQATLTADFALKKLQVKKVVYLHDNGEYGKGFVENNRVQLEKAGVETVLFEAINPDAVDFSSVVRKLRRAKPDALFFGGYQPTASKLVQQMRRDHVNVPIIGPDGLKDEAFIKMAGKDAEGIYTSYPSDTSNLPAYTKAVEQHVKMFGTQPGSFFPNAYAATQALLNAIDKAQSTDTVKIMEALRSESVETPVGTIKFNAKGDPTGVGLSIYQIRNGKYVEVGHSITLN
ncbi:MAG: branched-chain amino acid ABC transporter substrate-binding protein [Desulfovibrionaceae bacterium]|nr:branched-chain amino acid ABC transporter substrate-binding protein [Desulfovibrionaceae bacterium]